MGILLTPLTLDVRFHRYVFCPPEKGLSSPSTIVNIDAQSLMFWLVGLWLGEVASERGFLVEMVLESRLEAG